MSAPGGPLPRPAPTRPAPPATVPGRRMAVVAGVLGLGYLLVYLLVMAGQDSLGEAWGYAVAVAVATSLCAVAVLTGKVFVPVVVAAVLFAGLAFLGLLSIGLLLVPAVVCAGVSAGQSHAAPPLAAPRAR